MGKKPAAVTVPLRVTRCSHCLFYFTLDGEIVVTRIEGASRDSSMPPTQAAKDLQGKFPLPGSSQASDRNLLFVPCCSTLKRRASRFARDLLSHKGSSDRELRLKSYTCCLSGSIFMTWLIETMAYVYSRVHSSIMEKRATPISSCVLNCPFLEAKWCGELFIIIVPQISTTPFC